MDVAQTCEVGTHPKSEDDGEDGGVSLPEERTHEGMRTAAIVVPVKSAFSSVSVTAATRAVVRGREDCPEDDPEGAEEDEARTGGVHGMPV